MKGGFLSPDEKNDPNKFKVYIFFENYINPFFYSQLLKKTKNST